MSAVPVMENTAVEHVGQWALVWLRFRRHRLAVVAMWVCLLLLVLAIVGPLIAPPFAIPSNGMLPMTLYHERNMAPSLSWRYLFGTDAAGQPILSYVLAGGRPILAIAVLGSLLATVAGSLIGGMAGYLAGPSDAFLMRVTDAVLAAPFLLLLILIGDYIPQHTVPIYILLFGLVGWPGTARLVRGYVLSLREREYAVAARALGVPAPGIVTRHLLPNALDVIVVSFSLNCALFLIAEATLDFLTFGVGATTVTWGSALATAFTSILNAYWWQFVFPSAAILTAVLAINLVGDGLRDALDVSGPVVAARRRGPLGRGMSVVTGTLTRALAGVPGRRHGGVTTAGSAWDRWARQSPVPARIPSRLRPAYTVRLPLALCIGPIVAAFVVPGLVFLWGHSPLRYSPNYGAPQSLGSTYGPVTFGAHADGAGWSLFRVDARGRLMFERYRTDGTRVSSIPAGRGDYASEPALGESGSRQLGAWIAGQGQVLRVAVPGRRAISLVPPGGLAEHPDVVPVPGGFDVLFDWEPAGTRAYDIYLATLRAGRVHVRRLIRTGDYGLLPRGVADRAGNLDVLYLQRVDVGAWQVRAQRFTTSGSPLGAPQVLSRFNYVLATGGGTFNGNVLPGQWPMDVVAAGRAIWAAWGSGDVVVANHVLSGSERYYLARWTSGGVGTPALLDGNVPATGGALTLALWAHGGQAYYVQSNGTIPYIVSAGFDLSGRVTGKERVDFTGGGIAANPHGGVIGSRPAVIWEKIAAQSAQLEWDVYGPSRPPDLLTHLGLNIGNPVSNILVVVFGSIAMGLGLSLVNLGLLLPLIPLRAAVRRWAGGLEWPLFVGALGALLLVVFVVFPASPVVFVIPSLIGSPGAGYAVLAVAAAVVAAAWAGRYLLAFQESALRATVMAILALTVVTTLDSSLFIQTQINGGIASALGAIPLLSVAL